MIWANSLGDHEGVTELQDVIDAWQAIAAAELRYRETVRSAIADGVPQVAISKAIDRTREMIRRDAMPEEERERLRLADIERVRRRRMSASRPTK